MSLADKHNLSDRHIRDGHDALWTYEAHGFFTYKPGQWVNLTSDDDAWLFINGRRVIDLAAHRGFEHTGEVHLDR